MRLKRIARLRCCPNAVRPIYTIFRLKSKLTLVRIRECSGWRSALVCRLAELGHHRVCESTSSLDVVRERPNGLGRFDFMLDDKKAADFGDPNHRLSGVRRKFRELPA
ncbi:MAG TPA: hypothetical protein PLY00_00005, partial [Verrucomicrobiota bacterium]|nr:hypothetical protein [Verrucomicrobiota bacterium]HOF46628.1 hypothetical protein [Verrucomicrobiota bacterium]HOG88105.1 hypothetical protein [Verrucomicrobiota bacterium]HOR69667.1 hypothetical protein [Verrucomicrobiota bacterium]HPW81989.1 hypothetical protein [Verrucomicrobiota bacterium]